MADRFEQIGLKGGIWQGVLHRDARPGRVILTHLGETVTEARVTEDGPGHWRVAVSIPSDRISDGVQSFILVEDGGAGLEPPGPGADRLAVVNLLAGAVLDEDIQAEISLLKAEIELLKREFRRMAAERRSSGDGAEAAE
ncbi:hypothetical protein PE067_17100 [Paracoccus sp. DMF-8]|uniref:hypothetical protein n=1 Tax=Paracoccus sp. DMF-8 TaxID=3019445 RepID=UPI0023E3F35F|nr:hypothetical protein [Paracoccus sp. DMF-8]MDF3607704.1 hypothetical protein [Paracoccus sp. DMF-8]